MTLPITTKAIVLEMLTQGPATGKDVAYRAEAITRGSVEVTNGSLYPALRSLEEEGFIRTRRDGTYELTRRGTKTRAQHRALVGSLFGLAPETPQNTTPEARTTEEVSAELLAGTESPAPAEHSSKPGAQLPLPV